ncbi:MAG: substrate-binding domain-containing protein [Deinococcota bacterium]
MKRVVSALAALLVAIFLVSSTASAQDSYEIVFIPKLVVIPWFSAMENGFKDYAGEAGDLSITVVGAPDTDPAAQARLLEDAIARGPDAIVVVPNDTQVLEPILARGRDAGILMVTQEAPGVVNADLDIEFLIAEQYGSDMMDLFVREAGEEGGYAIMVGGLTVESHNQRADMAVAYQEANYPGLYQVTSRLEGSESVEDAQNRTLELIAAYDDLVGVMYIGSLGAIGGAQAVTSLGTEDIAIVGGSVPSQAKIYLEEGSINANYISNPYRIGRDSAHLVRHILEGGTLADVGNLPEYGVAAIDGTVITFHAPSEVTAENADSFGF